MPCDRRERPGIAKRDLEGFMDGHLSDQQQVALAFAALARAREASAEAALGNAFLAGRESVARLLAAMGSLRGQTAALVVSAAGRPLDWRLVAYPEAARRALAAALALREPELYARVAADDLNHSGADSVGRLVAESLRYASRGQEAEYAWQVAEAVLAADRAPELDHRHDQPELRSELAAAESEAAPPLLDLTALQREPVLVRLQGPAPARPDPEL